jgi:hypothetical protein
MIFPHWQQHSSSGSEAAIGIHEQPRRVLRRPGSESIGGPPSESTESELEGYPAVPGPDVYAETPVPKARRRAEPREQSMPFGIASLEMRWEFASFLRSH